ncbi:TPA_asm: nucleocapsid protein [Periplaneta americana mononega-like virus]|uniref:Nucleocapsid protein n=1 Tax=Periplaneta americana mononega-like virus TaxID=2968923 RepID=A0AAV2YG78_9VIRU|nr:nucleocapsid protein [Periplaneta americana mononega-like virus]DAZ90403.1 TPA_asm: nucleocapsid protein [Periplaneta americana mononega-like virus]
MSGKNPDKRKKSSTVKGDPSRPPRHDKPYGLPRSPRSPSTFDRAMLRNIVGADPAAVILPHQLPELELQSAGSRSDTSEAGGSQMQQGGDEDASLDDHGAEEDPGDPQGGPGGGPPDDGPGGGGGGGGGGPPGPPGGPPGDDPDPDEPDLGGHPGDVIHSGIVWRFMQGRRMRGILDTQATLIALAPEHPMTRGFVCSVFDHGGPECIPSGVDGQYRQLTAEEIHNVLLMHTIVKALEANLRGEDPIKIGLVGELMAPYLPNDRMSVAAAQRIWESATTMLQRPTQMLMDTATYNANAIPLETAAPLGTIEDALLCYVSIQRFLRRPYLTYLRDIQIEFMYAVCTRGNTTEAKVRRFSQNYQEQTGVEPNISPERVRLYYQYYGRYLDATNIRPILETWKAELPEPALSMRLIVSQAAYGGMTQLMTIGLAVLTFPDFPWMKLASVFPGEFEAVQRALVLVHGNPYFGYTRDMGMVASRHYKNLAYAAKELLIRSGGHDSLRAYAGWPRSCIEQQGVTALLDQYLQRRAAGLTADHVPPSAAFTAAATVIVANQEMFLSSGFGLDA